MRLNLFLVFISFSLSAFSVFLGVWWRKRKEKSAEEILIPKKERVTELSLCIVAEYDLKYKLIKQIVRAILVFDNDPIIEFSIAMDLIKLKDIWSEIFKQTDLQKKFPLIASFDYMCVKIIGDVQLFPASVESQQLQSLFFELRRCERRIKIYRQCYNDAVRIFNATLIHYQNCNSTYRYLGIISED